MLGMRTGRLRRLATASCALGLGAAVVACGGDDGGTATKDTATQAQGQETSKLQIPQSDSGFPPLDSPDKRATGEPLKFAMISLENSNQGVFPEQRQAGEAAIRYVNTKLGGIAGRPIELEVCKTDGTPAGSSSCANKLLQQQPVAFFGAADFATYQSVPLLERAGVPWIGGLSFGGPEALSKNSFLFAAGSTTVWPSIPQYAVEELGAKNLALTQPTGNPGAEVAAELVRGAIDELGAKQTTVPLDPTAPDVTPQMTQMNASNPDAIVGINTGTQCVALAQARKSLGVKAAFFLPSGCADPRAMEQLGDAAEGIYMPFEVEVPGDKGPDVQLYDAVMKEFAPETPRNEFASTGFQSVMNTYTVLKDMKPDEITSESIIEAFRNARDVPNFMGPKFTCDKPVPAYPSVCNPLQVMAQHRGGEFVPVSEYFDPSKYTNAVKVGG